MTAKDSIYIHGTASEEQYRLSRLNDLLNRRSLQELRLRPGLRVLDIGSGLGQLARAMAREVGVAGTVVGIERDPAQRAEAERQAAQGGERGLVDFRPGDALSLPLAQAEWESFDVVHARFVLEHVPDPQAVVDAMFRAARPGGRIVLEDDDHDLLRLWPALPALDPAWDAYIATYDALGNDPYVGRRLVALLRQAGAASTRAAMLFFGSCATDPNLPLLVENFAGILDGARTAMIETGQITDAALDEALVALDAWGRLPDAAFWYTTCWAAGWKPNPAQHEAHPIPVPHPADEQAAATGPLTGARFLADSAKDLNSSLHLDEVFRKIADRVHQLLDYHLFCILLWNEEIERLEFSYSLRFGEHIAQEGSFPLGTGLGGSAAQLRHAIRVDDVSQDPRYVRVRHTEVEIRSELVVPLIVKDRLIGVLDLESTEYAAFTAEHEEVLTTLASHIAIALENARLYQEVQTREIRHQDDLSTARLIQRGLLPVPKMTFGSVEIAARYHPAAALSGDFYDLIPYTGQRLAVAVADVAGKGTGAAMYGAMAVGALRGHALRRAGGPSEMFAALNGQLTDLAISRRFLAIVLALWDEEARTLEIANAGLPLPLRLRAGQVEELAVSGLPLGQNLQQHHAAHTFPVASGDVVLFYSDGITEGMNATGEPFGNKRVERYLATQGNATAQEIAAGLVRASLDFATGSHVSTGGEEDDRTLLVMRFR